MRILHGARRSAMCIAMLIGAIAPAASLSAQETLGTVRDSASHQPISAAVVLLVDSSGVVLARRATDASGEFRFPGTPGARQLRVLRLGFQPLVRPLSNAESRAALDIFLATTPVHLAPVRTTARAACPARDDRAAAFAVLEQVRAALLATVIAAADNRATMTRLLFDRRLDGNGDRIASQSVRVKVAVTDQKPFGAARSASEFVREGFRMESDGGYTFFAPDAETLLSDDFASGYCFSLMRPDRSRPRQLGLGFEPAARGSGRIDVSGALWVDTTTRALHDLEFHYLGLERDVDALRPGGRISFRQLPNGITLIDRWALRLVSGRRFTGAGSLTGTGEIVGRASSRLTVREVGGELAQAEWPSGEVWKAPLGTLRLRAFARGGEPAPGTRIELLDTDYQATTDSTGSVVLESLLPGPYAVAVGDPKLSQLSTPLNTSLTFVAERDSTVVAKLGVETAEDLVRRRCAQDGPLTGGGWILGRVMTRDGKAVDGAHWLIRDGAGSTLVQGGRVGGDGLFHWCRLPFDTRVEIEGWQGDRHAKSARTLSDHVTIVPLVLDR
ncbi:MAG TPA: carboxypeptidase-like regulatory domain-containing protein [Gemmatimonadaceae bacterium]